MLKYFLVGVVVASLVSCLSSESYEPRNDNAVAHHYGATIVASLQELPACNSVSEPLLYYTSADSTFHYCGDPGYVTVDMQSLAGSDGSVDCEVVPLGDGDYGLLCGENTFLLPRAPDSTPVDTPPATEPEPEIRCGELVYDPAASTCIDGVPVANASVGFCKGAAFDKTSSICFHAVVVAKTALRLCGTAYYDPLVSACLKSKIVPIESVEYCGEQVYDPWVDTCKNGELLALGPCERSTLDLASQLCDERDGHVYTYARLGGLDWMTQNLNFEINDGAGSWCYSNDPANCKILGRLYDWATARGVDSVYNAAVLGGSDADIQGICPVGWHLPSNADWGALVANWTAGKTAFGYVNAGEHRSGQTSYEWLNSDGNMILWSATEVDAPRATRFYVTPGRELKRGDYIKIYGHAVRCVRAPVSMP